MNDWLNLIFDKEKEWGWQSTVITDWKKCYKLYDLAPEDIALYSAGQNALSRKEYVFDFDSWLEIWTWKRIKKVKVKFLNISSKIYSGTDIYLKSWVCITELPLIEWNTLDDCWELNTFLPLCQKIDEKISEDYWLDMSIGRTWYWGQTNPYNIKIQYIEWEVMWVIVTDMCMGIETFLQKNKRLVLGMLWTQNNPLK